MIKVHIILIKPEIADAMLKDLVSTDLPAQTSSANPLDDVVMSSIPTSGGAYNNMMFQNPYMMQYLAAANQQNPYAAYNMGGSVPNSPFGIRRKQRKLMTLE